MTMKSRLPKPKSSKGYRSKDLWISPRLSMRGEHGDRAWDRSGNLPPGAGARFLELADIALGQKKAQKKNSASLPAHKSARKEPYSI